MPDKRYNDLIRIGIFYDGNYFLHVSNYYNYQHDMRSRISIAGLHALIRELVAEEEGTAHRFCQIVDAHYFRGRLSAGEAQRSNKLYPDRIFDDVLMSEGITTHYMPLRSRAGKKEEKGVDVWLAMEAYDQAVHRDFDVFVLISSDGDYVPLIRKLNALGTKVMLLAWDFDYVDDNGKTIVTKTSQDLISEATYPVDMCALIDERLEKGDPMIGDLFVRSHQHGYQEDHEEVDMKSAEEGKVEQSRTLNMNNGYGFIQKPPNNLFFHHQDVIHGSFQEIRDGDIVEYTIGRNERGELVGREVRKVADRNNEDFLDL